MTNPSPKEIAEEVAKVYADKTDLKIEMYQKNSTEAIERMAAAMVEMAKSVKNQNDSLVRYEEKQTAQYERAERLDSTIRELGINQRRFEKEVESSLYKIKDDVQNNSLVRKAAVWLAMSIIAALIGGGALFSSLTNKNSNQTHVHENFKVNKKAVP